MEKSNEVSDASRATKKRDGSEEVQKELERTRFKKNERKGNTIGVYVSACVYRQVHTATDMTKALGKKKIVGACVGAFCVLRRIIAGTKMRKLSKKDCGYNNELKSRRLFLFILSFIRDLYYYVDNDSFSRT